MLGPEHPDVAESLWLLGRLEARIEHDFEGAREKLTEAKRLLAEPKPKWRKLAQRVDEELAALP
ncbi:MAG: hypothetical protein IPJ19_20935 [Planctomycetes bacterium]|nr:hypothetical protein [Planctomycetota bacterium]